MAWLPKKERLKSMKDSLSQKADHLSDKVSSVDINETKDSIKNRFTNATEGISDKFSSIDFDEKSAFLKESVFSATERTKQASLSTYSKAAEKTTATFEEASLRFEDMNYSNLTELDYYKETFTKYKDISSSRVSEYFRATFEVDKDSMEVVEDIRRNLPIPAKDIDDIFTQCKQEAIRRAIASFCLSGVINNIDNHSEAKYENLSESYNQFSARTGPSMFDDPNFAAMKDERHVAKENWTQLENGYNQQDALYPFDADIEHVVARKEYYNDTLLRAGTTDDEFCALINSNENLVFANSSLNRALKDQNVQEYIQQNGIAHTDNPDLVDVTIKSTGEVVTVRKSDVEEAVSSAEENRQSHRTDAVKEIGATAIKTGATMATQQVVGLIVLETIDIFVDEIQDLTVNGRLLSGAQLVEEAQSRGASIQQRLSDRFEKRNLWSRARSLGISTGVAGALSVIPQILISLLIKMPAFVLAVVRECTLSLVRCVRLMASDDTDKLNTISVILAGSVSAIVGVYVAKVIGTAIEGVPLLNQYNVQISNVISGVIVVAVPLAAIYVFDQNKGKFEFITSRFKQNQSSDDREDGTESAEPTPG